MILSIRPRMAFLAIASGITFIGLSSSPASAQMQPDYSVPGVMSEIVRNAAGEYSYMTQIEAEDYCQLSKPGFSRLPTLEELAKFVNPEGVRDFSQKLQGEMNDDFNDNRVELGIKKEQKENAKEGYIYINVAAGDENPFFYNISTYKSDDTIVNPPDIQGSGLMMTNQYGPRPKSASGKDSSSAMISLKTGKIEFVAYTHADPTSHPRGLVRCIVQPGKPYPKPFAP